MVKKKKAQTSVASRISAIMYQVRHASGLSQIEIAKKLAISQPHLSKIERDQGAPSIIQWMAFCKLFEIPTDVILDADDFSEQIEKIARRVKQKSSE